MKALSIHPAFAGAIMAGLKTIEVRTWSTEYRGDLLICSTAKKLKDTIPSHALCVVRLADIIPFKKKHLKAACLQPKDYKPGMYAWILEDLRDIMPFEVKGKLSLWECNHDIEYLKKPDTPEEDEKMYKEIWEPLFI